MAQFRNTADLVDQILEEAGELSDGTSAYEADALRYANRLHQSIITGGTEFGIDIDKPFQWAKSRRPLILELKPKYDTGSVSLTNGSVDGTFSAAPTISLKGYHLKLDSRTEYMEIASHTAGATAFELDFPFLGDTESGLAYKAIKVDYDLIPSYIVIDGTNDKLDFEETTSTTLTANPYARNLYPE